MPFKTSYIHRRFKILFIFFLFLLAGGIIIFKLYGLQITKGEYYEALALGQHIAFEESIGKRGEIFLKNSEIALASLKKKDIVYIFSAKIPSEKIEYEADILDGILKEEKDDLIALINKGGVLRREVSEEAALQIRQSDLTAAYTDEFLTRFYPLGSLACHLVGFVNREGIGQYGVEGYYDRVLKGKEGLEQKTKSSFGYLAGLFSEAGRDLDQKGSSLLLNIDYNIQYFSQKLLVQANDDFNIDSGQIIAAEPKTGRILAMAGFPDFDLNNFASQDNMEIFLNFSTQKLFEPGSVFKPIVMAAALEEDLITPETTYEDKGFVEVGGPPIYNFGKRVWGEQTMTDVLEESINTGAIFVQQKLGKKLFLDYLEKFGFFEKTDIDLQGEVYSSNDTLKRGYARDLAAASFGQGIEITAVSLARAFGALANNGKLIRPTIVGAVLGADNKAEQAVEISPEIQAQVISPETSAKISSMLTSVVEQGSGRRAKINGYYIAGKTGTAQVVKEEGGYFENQTIQSFIGYFPAYNPQILIFVKLDNPKQVQTAAYSAVPLFRELAKYIIDLYEIPPDYE